MFDCHVHTKFSYDCTMDLADACEAAIKLGLDGIAFTDHVDLDVRGEDLTVDFDLYFDEISLIKNKYKDKIKVLDSVEIGIQPHVIDKSLQLINGYDFDYILASVHIIDRGDPYIDGYYDGKEKHDLYERYLQEIYFMIRNFDQFDMVGHFEYIIRKAHYADRSLRYADHSDIFDEIMKELIHQGKGFEINTATFKKDPPDAKFDFELLKRFRQLGGELICLGSDGHTPDSIAVKFDYYAQLIRDAGFKYTVHFENRKPVFDKL